jgi:hypothetical protein
MKEFKLKSDSKEKHIFYLTPSFDVSTLWRRDRK